MQIVPFCGEYSRLLLLHATDVASVTGKTDICQVPHFATVEARIIVVVVV